MTYFKNLYQIETSLNKIERDNKQSYKDRILNEGKNTKYHYFRLSELEKNPIQSIGIKIYLNDESTNRKILKNITEYTLRYTNRYGDQPIKEVININVCSTLINCRIGKYIDARLENDLELQVLLKNELSNINFKAELKCEFSITYEEDKEDTKRQLYKKLCDKGAFLRINRSTDCYIYYNTIDSVESKAYEITSKLGHGCHSEYRDISMFDISELEINKI